MPALYNRDTMPAIRPDMIPSSSWGSNLCNLLTRESWNKIRQPVFRRTEGLCFVCGVRPDRPECHELWAYSRPPFCAPIAAFGVQRLIGLVGVCQQCHEIFHPGRANAEGKADQAMKRMMATNRWSDYEFAKWLLGAQRISSLRSIGPWKLDLELVSGGGQLVIDEERGWSLRDDGFMARAPRQQDGVHYDEAVTELLGVSYSIGCRSMPALSSAESYAGMMRECGDLDFARSVGYDGEEPARAPLWTKGGVRIDVSLQLAGPPTQPPSLFKRARYLLQRMF